MCAQLREGEASSWLHIRSALWSPRAGPAFQGHVCKIRFSGCFQLNVLRLGLIPVYQRSGKDMWKTPWKGSASQPWLLIKRAVPTSSWHGFPRSISPRRQKQAPRQPPSTHFICCGLSTSPASPLELPGLAADSWPGIEGSKGFVGKWAGRSGEGPREEKEDGQSKLLIKARLRKSPCQEHSLTAKLPEEPGEELPSELEASLLSCSYL